MKTFTEIQMTTHNILETLSVPPGHVPYGVRMIGAEAEWSETRGAGVRVAVLDTGRPNHPDLRVAGAVDFTGTGVDDRDGHSTHVCGIIAANGRLLGVAPAVELFTVKVLDDQGRGSFDWVVEGIRWCMQNRINVINFSLGGNKPTTEDLHNILRAADTAGIILVAATGNMGPPRAPQISSVLYPAVYDECIATAAVDINRVRPEFSSAGAEVDLAAAGVEVHSTHLNQQYVRLSGTSMACPHIAGAAALMIAKARIRRKPVTPAMIRYAMQIYADDLGIAGRDDLHGFGVFSFGRVVELEPLHLRFRVGQRTYTRNGAQRTAHVAPQLLDGRTMIGLRDVGEALDCQVQWTPPDTIDIRR